ncbi:MAG: alanine racemase [Alphaproteobacteria bacterium]|nr:alanine racemase [Alphaproteobacteria bacterium]
MSASTSTRQRRSTRIWRPGILTTTPPIERAATRLSIDLDALTQNWRNLKARGNGADCAGIVKANAYGLGVERVAPALWNTGCRRFFTANPDGASTVRQLLPDAEVFVLNGLLGEPEVYVEEGLTPVLNDLGQVERWTACARSLGRRLPAILQADTGMMRLGLPPAEIDHLQNHPELCGNLDIRFVMSHLANADAPDDPSNARQLEAFRAVRTQLPSAPASLANSSGIFLGRDYHFDLLRPGYAVYGGNPTPGRGNPMEPVIRLSAQIIQIRDAEPGQTVGYGGHHTIKSSTRVATIPLGYADGYRRTLGDRAVASIDGAEIPVVGRVSMDLVTLDIGALPVEKAHVGTWVDLIWGNTMLDDLAMQAGTIGYELLTALGGRSPRHYRGGDIS